MRIERPSPEWLRWLIAAVGLSSLACRSEAVVWFVRLNAAGANTGTSWNDAFTSIHSAMSVASPGDEVWVAAGEYIAGAGINLPSGVTMYGGFVGTETSKAQRNWVANVTALVGNWPSGPGPAIITVTNPAPGTAIDGLAIRNGNAVHAHGAGLVVNGGTIAVRHCRFESNYVNWGFGGGIYANNAVLDISDCRFVGNYAHLACGAGVALSGATSATIRDCVFSGNTAVTAGNGGEGLGAGLYNESSLPVTVLRCTFDSNVARGFYTCQNGPQWAWGGALDSLADGLVVRDCVFLNNRAHYGGAMFVWGSTQVINTVFRGNTATTICSGTGTAGGEGGALGGWTFQTKTLELVNCTIAGNFAREGAGINTYGNLGVLLRNCIVWGNVANGEGVEPLKRQMRGTITPRYSCVQDLFTPVPGEDPPNPADFPGCIDSSPVFVNLAGGNLRLQPTSPCIDAGSNGFLPAGVMEDLDRSLRVVRGLPGSGSSVVDMGAYEYASTPCSPTITVQPESLEACAGDDVVLTVEANGTGPITYQWFRDGAPIPGATLPSLTLPAATPADEGAYACMASNACGDVMSDAAMVAVSECPPGCDPDVNCDGSVDGFDVEVMEQAVAGDLSNFCRTDPDFNHDGSVDGFDVESVEAVVGGAPCP
jgi:hypothetical protein